LVIIYLILFFFNLLLLHVLITNKINIEKITTYFEGKIETICLNQESGPIDNDDDIIYFFKYRIIRMIYYINHFLKLIII